MNMFSAAPNPVLPHPCKVIKVQRNTHDVFTFDLDAGRALDRPFKPGQFNMLYVFGVGEVPISISGDPARQERILHTTRAIGTVTCAMGRLKKGSILGLRGPYGTPWPVDRALGRDVVIVAGGIGLAPLRPVLYTIVSQRNCFRRVSLLYGTRGPEDILYRNELDRWQNLNNIDVRVTVDRAIAPWPGSVGVVTTLLARAGFEPSCTTAFICGPEVMMRHSALELLKRGMAAENIHVSLERNMKCAVGFCGHCQYGPSFVCKDGPVFNYARVCNLLKIREL